MRELSASPGTGTIPWQGLNGKGRLGVCKQTSLACDKREGWRDHPTWQGRVSHTYRMLLLFVQWTVKFVWIPSQTHDETCSWNVFVRPWEGGGKTLQACIKEGHYFILTIYNIIQLFKNKYHFSFCELIWRLNKVSLWYWGLIATFLCKSQKNCNYDVAGKAGIRYVARLIRT